MLIKTTRWTQLMIELAGSFKQQMPIKDTLGLYTRVFFAVLWRLSALWLIGLILYLFIGTIDSFSISAVVLAAIGATIYLIFRQPIQDKLGKIPTDRIIDPLVEKTDEVVQTVKDAVGKTTDKVKTVKGNDEKPQSGMTEKTSQGSSSEPPKPETVKMSAEQIEQEAAFVATLRSMKHKDVATMCRKNKLETAGGKEVMIERIIPLHRTRMLKQ